MSGKCTIDDIARLAKVSKATVSRVINRRPDVDPITRERVLRIINEQGYIPSPTAAGLAGLNRLIGMLIPPFTWPFISDIARGAAEVIEHTSYELVLYSSNDHTPEYSKTAIIERIVATKLTAGLLAVYPGSSWQHLSRLHNSGFPVVVIDDQEYPTRTPREGAVMPWVGTDNHLGAYMAVQHLLSLGHRRIAHIQGPMKHLCSRERNEGYCQALLDAGITPDPELVGEGDFKSTSGQAIANRFFSLPAEQRPTAIFAASDFMAYGVLTAAEEHNLHIPRDIALIGFDDITTSEHIRPALTTVRQPFYEMGQHSMKLLLSLLETGSSSGSKGEGKTASSTTTPSSGHKGKRKTASPTTTPEHTMKVGTCAEEDQGDTKRHCLPISLVVRASCGAPHPATKTAQTETVQIGYNADHESETVEMS